MDTMLRKTHVIAYSVGLLLLAACGETSGTDNNGGNPDSGTDSTQDGTPDSTEDSEELTCDVDLSGRTHPTTYADSRPVQVIIESVDMDREAIVVRNVSAAEIVMNDNWRVYTQGSNRSLNGVTIPAGGRAIMYLTSSGAPALETYYFDQPTLRIEPCGGEIGIIHNDTGEGWSGDPSFVEAFVMWGDRVPSASTSTYNDEAYAAGAWSASYVDSGNYRVSTCYADGFQPFCGSAPPCSTNDLGIFYTGDITTPDGWSRVEDSSTAGCFGF